MLALIHALDLARQSITQNRSKTIPIQKATIYCSSQSVVHRVNFYINHSSEALQNVTSAEDQALIKSVIRGVKKLSRHSHEVSISFASL